MIRKLLPILVVFLIGTTNTFAQQYKEMIDDPSINFYDVVEEAEIYFRTIDLTKKGNGYKKFLRWKNENESIYYPTGRRDNIDPNLAKNSFDNYKQLFPEQIQENNTRMSGTGWRELGPNSIDLITGHYAAGIGRVEDVYVDPTDKTKLYLGSRSGGLWRSTDEGDNWIGGSTDFLPACGVNTISGDPLNSDHILINVRNSRNSTSYGIYESVDGGETLTETAFNPVNLGLGGLGSNFQIYRVAYHPTIAGMIFIGTNNGLYRSTDNLANWTQVSSGRYSQVIFHPTNPQIIYTQNQLNNATRNFLLKSTNGGASFAQTNLIVGNNSRNSKIAVTPAEPNSVFWGNSNGYWKSTDVGVNFTAINNSLGTGVGGFSVHTTNPSNIILGYVDMFNSTDGGVNFTQRTRWSLGTSPLHPSSNFMTNYLTSEGYIHADTNWSSCVNSVFYVMTDGMLAKSEDGGFSWTNLMRSGVGIRENYKLGVSQSNNGISISGSQDNGTSIYKDTGWIEFYGADGMECLVHPLNDDWMISSVQYGSRRRTKDGGFTQGGATAGGSASGFWESPLAYDPNNHMTTYDFRDGVRKSTEFGSNYTLVGTPSFGNTIQQAEIAQNDSNIIVVSNGSSIEKSIDGGASFSSIRVTLPNNSIQDIAFDPQDDNTILVVYNTYQNNGNKVYMTADGGASWSNITSNLGNMPIHSVVVDHSAARNIYLGTEVGVFTKPMIDNTWVLYSDELPNTSIQELEINWGANTIKAATWGRGQWESDLVNRDTYPSINYTEISDVPTESHPKENVEQFVTSEIVYAGTLSNVYVRWSIGTPDFTIVGNTVPMSNTVGDTWVSDTEIPNQPEGTKVYFKVFAEGDSGDISETYKFMYTVNPFAYCDAAGGSGTGSDYINRVAMDSNIPFENTSGQAQYTLYDALTPIELTVGDTHTLEIELNFAFAPDLAGAWIDYDGNGDFTSDEQITMSAFNSSNISTGTFTVSNTAILEEPLRMRTRNSWNSTINPCGTVSGEVEDYFVIISINIAPLAFCQDITVPLDENGMAVITAEDVDGGSISIAGNPIISINQDTFTCANIGLNNVEFSIIDDSGLTNICTAIVTIVDEDAPLVQCQDLTLQLDATGTVSITAVDIDNGSTDNCAIDTISIDTMSFDCTNIGVNMVTLTVVDTSGNTNSCTAMVTIEDTVAPVISCQDITVELNQNGEITIVPNDLATFNDACGIATTSIDIASFNCDDIGTPVNVTLVVEDNSGNSNSCSVLVTVIDSTNPLFDLSTLPNAIVTRLADENGEYFLEDFTPGVIANDNCDGLITNLSQDPTMGTVLTEGTYDVTLSATDGSSNTIEYIFELVVEPLLGVVDTSEDYNTIKLFPNPASNRVTLNNPRGINLTDVRLFDITGRLLQTVSLEDMEEEKILDVSKLSSATYLVVIRGENGILTRQLVKE